ncbi:MAG: hypothetical protein NT154_18210, partial [Verrucomicrobia bacterium]|nr:hypothetical protein [Verrucomicrobiota bacterium]
NDPSYVPQNGGPNSAARYTTTYTYDYQEGQDFASIASELGITQSEAQARLTAVPMGLGDINSDLQTNGIHGNRIRSTLPTAHLLPGSNQATAEGSTNQPIVTLYTYNQFGQMTSTRDPEGNVTQYSYNPENDPTGTGQSPTSGVGAGPFGYLHQRVADAVSAPGRDSGANPPPAAISRIYGYNLVGNVIRVIDGRGIATDYAVNQLNQVVQVTRAAAHGLSTNGVYEPLALTDFQYLTRIFYDANNNVVHRQVEDRGSTSTPDGFVDTFYQYDILNHPVQVTQEADTNTWLETNYRYDANGNPTWVVQPQGNAVGQSFDERNLPFETTIGATNPPPGTLGALPLGGAAFVGIPSIYTRNYDQNRNVIEFVDAADKDGSAANNSSIAGVGDATRYAYDGFDRRNAVTNAVGSQTLYTYDPAGRIVRRITRGPVGGPSPTDALGIDNVDLSVEDFKYDELRRLLQRDRLLFIPDGVATQRTISLTDGPLTPADGWISTRHEYDRNSRLTFSVDDNVNTAHNFYDGANRRIKTLDPESNTVEWAYDGNGNSIETRATDVCQVSGVTNEVFLITRFYDSLNHVQRRVDNVGQTSDYRYDSRANLVAASDANGPVSGSIVRRAFSKGALTVDAINGFGNVTLYSYDALNRKTRQDCVMTASGRGDGTHIGADMFGVKGAIPTPDTTQAGGDGLITTRFQYDANSRLTSLTDDNGNQTQRAYDNHNRKLTETKGICMPPNVADLCADPTTIFYQYDTDGNPAQFQDENGSIITNHFDAASRPIARDILRAPNVVGTTSLTYQYDGKSRLVFGADNNEPADLEDDSVITYAYDSLGRTVEESEQIGSTPAKAVSSFWEGSNHRTLLVYPNGRSVTNTFDHLNRLQTIADFGSNTPIATYSYLGKRRVAKRDYPSNNTRMTYLDN